MDPKEELWNQVYDARRAYFENTIGPLPNDILKMIEMTGIWPGGGLFVIPADRVGPDVWAYTTFGLTNPDMPTTVTTSDARVENRCAGTQADDRHLKAQGFGAERPWKSRLRL